MSTRSDREEKNLQDVNKIWQRRTGLYGFVFYFLACTNFSWSDKGLLMLKHVASYYITNKQLRFRCFREYLWLYKNNGTPTIKI